MAARPRRGTLRGVSHQVFISYASEDRARAGQLAAALEAEGLTVWWDRKIVAGHQFDQVIEEALDAAQCVLVCWTTHSVGSEWVKNEAAAGAEREVLVPVRLDAVKLPLEFRRRQTVDLSGWRCCTPFGGWSVLAQRRRCPRLRCPHGARGVPCLLPAASPCSARRAPAWPFGGPGPSRTRPAGPRRRARSLRPHPPTRLPLPAACPRWRCSAVPGSRWPVRCSPRAASRWR
jgi:hypothetical protein